jgi:hypothetical protein
MEDKRRLNGGHSTKTAGLDKRKNPFKDLISQAVSEKNFITIFQKLEGDAMKGNVQSAKLYLEYTIGKPMQSVDITSDGGSITIPTINFTANATDIDSEDI